MTSRGLFHTRRRCQLVLGLIVVPLALAACGTTVPQVTSLGDGQQPASGTAAGQQATGPSGDGLGDPGQQTSTSTGPATTTVAGGATGATTALPGAATNGAGSAPAGSVTSAPVASGSTVRSTTTGKATGKASAKPATTKPTTGTSTKTASSTAPVTSAAATSIPATGPGWDKQYVYVGLMTVKDASTALSTAGLSIAPGDEAGDGAAVVAGINNRGGLFGRQIKLEVFDTSSVSIETNVSSAASAACTHFTQDQPVITVINTSSSLDVDSLRGCFAQGHVPLIDLTTSPFDNQTSAQYAPYFYNALSVTEDHLEAELVQHLGSEGFFTGWNSTTGAASPTSKVKVGVLYAGDVASVRAGQGIVAALTKAGYPATTYQYGDATTDGNSAVLAMESAGVTHIIATDAFLEFFLNSANSQNYYPRVSVNTYNGVQSLLSTLPAKQLSGALGVGWYPTLDVNQAQDPGPSGPATAQCLSDLSAGGENFTGRFAEAEGLAECDGFRLAVLGAQNGGGLDPASIRSGIVKLGTSFPVAGSFGSGLSSTDYGLPGAGRDLGYDSSCSCFTYRGSNYPL